MKYQTPTTKAKTIKRHWHLIDLSGQILGRVASRIAILLQGKTKPYYVAHLDCGDYVVAINAQSIKVTGRKHQQKVYFRHSGYPGGVKQTPFNKLLAQNSCQVIELAVKGMLPKNKLRTPRLRRLKVFSNSQHTYQDKFKKQAQ